MLDIKELSKAIRQVAEEKGLAPETITEASNRRSRPLIKGITPTVAVS